MITSFSSLFRRAFGCVFALSFAFTAAHAAILGWTDQDIGAVSSAGAASFSGGTFTVTGSGADIWDNADAFHFLYYSLSGDGTFVARVTGVQNTHGWAKAGIMMRESLAPGSRHVMACTNPNGTGAHVFRAATDGPSDFAVSVSDYAPMWLAIQRTGTVFRTYQSTDGVNWVAIGSTTLNLSGPVYVGLAVTSHVDGTDCTATFDNVRPMPVISAGTPTNLRVTHRGPAGEIDLAWDDHSTTETGFTIQEKGDTRDDRYGDLATVGANVTTYVARGFEGRFRFYHVKAVNDTSSTQYSNELGVMATIRPIMGLASDPTPTSITIRLQGDQTTIGGAVTGPWALERSFDGITFTQIAANLGGTSGTSAQYTDSGLTPNTTYYYRARYLDSNGDVSSYTPVLPPKTAAGSASTGQDIGSPGAAGSHSVSGSSATVTGSGADIFGAADAFHFAYQPFSGDGQIVARILSIDNTSGWAKAGVMFRNDTSASSAHVFMMAGAGNGSGAEIRFGSGGATNWYSSGIYTWFPFWVKIVRQGNLFTSYRSFDGIDWVLVSSETVALNTNLLVGLAVTSHNDGVLCTAQFDHFAVSGPSAPPAPPAAPTNLTAVANSDSQVTLSWTDNSTNETGFYIERSRDGTNWGTLFTVPANTTTRIDGTVIPSETVYYRVRASAGGASGPFSAYTNTAGVTTPAASTTWSQAAIGQWANGSATVSGSDATVTVNADDIWDTADSFYYVYRSLTGDGQIVARVTSQDGSQAWARTGLMFRDSTAANSANAYVFVTRGAGVAFQTRASAGAATDITYGPWWITPPQWLKLVRAGDTFTAYYSSDGATWTLVNSQTIAMGASITVGVAATSHDIHSSSTSSYTDLSLQ
jgi:regulation of enolase protein 1 (concanavalin A-like superfamily)